MRQRILALLLIATLPHLVVGCRTASPNLLETDEDAINPSPNGQFAFELDEFRESEWTAPLYLRDSQRESRKFLLDVPRVHSILWTCDSRYFALTVHVGSGLESCLVFDARNVERVRDIEEELSLSPLYLNHFDFLSKEYLRISASEWMDEKTLLVRVEAFERMEEPRCWVVTYDIEQGAIRISPN